ncbi:autotransporter outer membrane beta-barrel domain-containing protein [Candidatus Poribacteria bacterium]|nr:autotransporter outer membrane beta-barrel domain-containing protein [Candidatus Poribacteria bacterium]
MFLQRNGDAGAWNGSTTELKIRINGTVTSTNPPVSTPTQDTQEPAHDIAANILTTVGAQALSSALDNIGTRIGGSLPQANLNIAGFQVPPVSGETDQGFYDHCRFGCDTQSDRSGYHSIDSDDLLQSSAFSLNLGASEGQTDFSTLDWSIWGRADLAAFEGRPAPAAHYDGRAKSGWFGIDGRTQQWVAGAALSKTWSETDYRLDASSGPQRMRTELTALYPYGRWALDERSALHAIAGIGSGEVSNMRDGSVQEKSDLSMRMLSVGVERQLAPRSDGMELSVRAEASTVRLKTDSGDESIDGLTPESWRIRMGLEGSRRISRDDGTVMEPFFDLAVRRDGGDGLEGYGMEAAGGARYTVARVQLEFRGRMLLAHSGRGVRESGLSVTFQYLPESDGRGLSLSFRPHWGIAANGGADALWRDEMPQAEEFGDASSFDARIGYGFDLPSTGGVVTPFAENIHNGDSRALSVGARFDAPRDNLAMQLSGERSRNAEDVNPRDSIKLDFSVRF